ncbi:hypothetical protein, partial [Acrocarpospora corrugata]|uniref:hypothetical protein n=1 Tax=Acrocarpospora corrugata TaxID=35763 RepID=UPI0031DCD275
HRSHTAIMQDRNALGVNDYAHVRGTATPPDPRWSSGIARYACWDYLNKPWNAITNPPRN